MTAHTPGPWSVSPYSSIVGIAISGGGYVIAGVRGDREFSESNARLIAAAPDLYALAQRYASECAECAGTGEIRIGHHDRADTVTPCHACADIHAVLAKVEGL